MARERMVTRTVLVTTATAMCVEVNTCEVKINDYEISGTFSDNEQALKTLKKLYETETFKVVAVQALKENEILYGMSELDFIKQAKVLPPRGSKEEQE